MPRKPRFAPPGYYLHLTQRGNYRQTTFHCQLDYEIFQQILAEHAEWNGVQLLAYCQMPNHYHLVARSERIGGIPAFMRGLNGNYARYLHGRLVRKGRLWQDRYYGSVLSTSHLILAMRYVELNPVRAKLVETATQYRCSSARIHSGGGAQNALACMDGQTFSEMYDTESWRQFLAAGETRHETSAIRLALQREFPLGGPDFVDELRTRFPDSFLPRAAAVAA